MSQNAYVVAGCKPWNLDVYKNQISELPGHWQYIDHRDKLTAEFLDSLNPRYIFFLHWSWLVPEEFLNKYDCVCFHMTDVPYGRGGSPLQNMIVRGHTSTKLTALKMTKDFDAGPVYLKEDLSLEGGAEEIFIRASKLSARMIEKIIHEHPEPTEQGGEPVVFKRRKPEDSDVSELSELDAMYNHIRMLDAEGYPNANLRVGNFEYQFTQPTRYHGRIVAQVTIREIKKEST